jgi:hypothetical protein
MTFRRSEMRWPCDPRGVLAYLDGRDAPIAGKVVEVSRAGLQLHVADPIPVGSRVTVEMGPLVLLGDVRHCDASPKQYYSVGLRTCGVRGE